MFPPFTSREDYLAQIKDEDKVKITKTAEVPKGDYCNWCQEQGSQFHPYFNSWTDALTSYESYGWCNFYNQRLYADKDDKCCNPRNKKCLACLMATNKDMKLAGDIILFNMIYQNYENAKTEENKERIKKVLNEVVKVAIDDMNDKIEENKGKNEN